MIMTINELSKEYDFIGAFGEEVAERLKRDIKKIVQPKTTSTDIEELRKEFDELLAGQYWKFVTRDAIWNLFAPHLSNKSELKKEAVREGEK